MNSGTSLVRRVSLIMVCYLCVAAGGISAFDWPVEARRLMATFGESRYGSFLSGIYLSCGESQVFPIADGEVIFWFEEGSGYHALARPNGSFVALQHEGRVQSVYSHLKLGTVVAGNQFLRARPRQIEARAFEADVLTGAGSEAERELLRAVFVSEGGFYTMRSDLPRQGREAAWGILSRIGYIDTIGIAGDTGLSEGVHLALTIIDVEQNKILNPIKRDKPPLLPPLDHPAPARRRGPVIANVFLRRGETLLELSDNMAIAPGKVEILAKIYDRSDFVSFARNMAPYKFYLAVSGKTINSIVMDALEEKNNRLVINDTSITHDDLYQDQWFYRLGRISLVEGKSVLQIGTESFLGDASILDLSLEVVPQ